MALVDLIMPKLGESIMEATVLKWLKQPGDTVEMDETVLEIATDKVDSEVPSTVAGVLEEILFNVNDVVPIGTVIARIKTDAAETVTHKPEVSTPIKEAASSHPDQVAEVVETIQRPAAAQTQPTNGSTNRFYSPLVLNIAASEGVSMAELEAIPGTGNEGRVTKKDILQFVSERKSGSQQSGGRSQSSQMTVSRTEQKQTESSTGNANQQLTTYTGNVEIIEMDRMRKLIADHMVRSKHTSPHVTSFTEADVTNMVMWRNKVKKDFEKREGTKITFTPLFIEAVVRCIKKFPLINCSLDGNNIIIKKDINIGMATALPSGNLIVSVVKNANEKNVIEIAKEVNNLAENARNNKLKPEQTQGSTFTISNVGTFGSLMGTPIINQPEVAILALGIIKKRPEVITTEKGDEIAIRSMMYLSLSFDHRVVDGFLGGSFLRKIGDYLEQFDTNTTI